MTATQLAPDLSAQLEWLNAPAATLAQQRGRVVLLAFWHAGSTYCQNLLEDLRYLHGKHADGISVFGIHSPKFEAERDAKLVRKAINRYHLRFPVAHDPGFVTWQHYGIRAWPSVALIDPHGRLVELRTGDLQRDVLDSTIAQLLEAAGAQNERVYETVQPSLRPEGRHALAFPAGLAVTPSHLYVSDTAHHRVLECSHEGRILRQFGSGNPGLLDGVAADCSFTAPRGLAVMKDMLYIADTGNHALRRVRLLSGEVDTLAGNGRPGEPLGTLSGPAENLPLNAPWDVAGAFDKLYLSMAGTNQLWEFDLGKRSMQAIAGSGKLGLADGVGTFAQFAQPAGLAMVQQSLYVADSAASAVRNLQLANGVVQTLIGQGLYEFGDQDGTRTAARLQYPLALALDPRSPLLWILDTYNNAVKMLRLGGGDLRRYEIEYRLHQPAAIAASRGALWIANTDAHEVIRVDLDGGTVVRLPIGE